jgi:exodeoxyribonuclease VIII
METRIESNESYHGERKHISSSALKTISKKSVYHYIHQPTFFSKSMNLGTLIHTAILEPKNFDKDYFLIPKINKRTNAGKELYAKYMEQANGRELIDQDTIDIKDAIIKNFNANEKAVYFNQGAKEMSYYSEINGVQVKVRPDCYNEELGFISDPKTCRDNTPKGFLNDVYKYGYHIQCAFYCDVLGVDTNRFVFTAIETSPPYSVQTYTLRPERVDAGREAYMDALGKWKRYLETGEVLSYDGYEKNKEGVILL